MPRHHVGHEKVENVLLLRLLQTLHLRDEFAVEEETLLASHRVHPDKRVDGVDGVFTYQTPHQTRMVDHLG